MNEFKHSVADALRYWERQRVLYNAVLTAVAVSWVVLTWPHFRSVQSMGIPPGDTHPALIILIILAFLANVCYSAAYLVDIPLQLTFATWRKYRWALLLTGTLFALLVENYWIADEIYPFAPK
jgi:hypothetical protein